MTMIINVCKTFGRCSPGSKWMSVPLIANNSNELHAIRGVIETAGRTLVTQVTQATVGNTAANREITWQNCAFNYVWQRSLDGMRRIRKCLGRVECHNAGNIFSPDRCHGNKEYHVCGWMHARLYAILKFESSTELSGQHVEHLEIKLRIEFDPHTFVWCGNLYNINQDNSGI